jgi:sugar phosphate isomerase/epimerase
MVSYESIYNGVESYSPTYKPTGHQVSISNIGMAMDARTANQLGELRTKINPGQKQVEVGTVAADAWESVPNQHIDEMRRGMELTGVTPTFHAPVIEVAGLTQQGWDEIVREGAEKQLTSAVIRGNKLSKDGNVNITMHTSGGGLPDFQPISKSKDESGKTITREGEFWIINEQTGKYRQLPKSKKYLSESGEFIPGQPVKDSQIEQLKQINKDQWVGSVAQINRMSEYAERDLKEAFSLRTAQEDISIYNLDEKKEGEIKEVLNFIYDKEYDPSKINNELIQTNTKDIKRSVERGKAYARESYGQLKQVFDTVYPTTSGEDRTKLDLFAKKIAPIIEGGMEKDPSKVIDFMKIVEEGSQVLNNIKEAPQIFKPMQDFVIDKTTDTFSNVALNAYKEYKDKAPIISLENPPAGGALSTGADVAKTVVKTREKFTEKLVKEFGMNESDAKRIAADKIGATWDVGHINMLKKFGYSDKDIVKETEKVAPYVKKVHLSDNFGMEHTELPMGMGNVPLKEMMKKVEKEGFKGPQIVEAGNWWQYFAEHGGGNPFMSSIEGLDSPIYAMKEGPSWNAYQPMGSYYAGQGAINPPQHHNLYGSGFTTLPQELGGQMPGGNSDRFSGTPMQ